jgi:uncharacterized protein YegJ (DUF2314 family)
MRTIVCDSVFEIVKLNDKVKDFQVLSHLWIVERKFGCLGLYRCLNKEYFDKPLNFVICL